MIQILDKKDCCGCNACVQRCPKQCIKMQPDNEGFQYPLVDTTLCIDCKLCEKVCPIINDSTPQQPLKVYAAYNTDEEVRLQSSSGGIYTLLAVATIKDGGVVFGVKFNEEWIPEFGYTETMEGIAPFRGSKYIQAIVGNAYKQAEDFLKNGRKVLFCGTPCQVSGLNKFLRKEYDNLLTVDIICHGVPSPKVWNMYLREKCYRLMNVNDGSNSKSTGFDSTYYSQIETINFRSKVAGWGKYRFFIKLTDLNDNKKESVAISEARDKNEYMRAFLSNIILRPSCYNCPAKQGRSHSDITIADFWGIDVIDPNFNDDKGCGAVLINTTKGAGVDIISQSIYKEKTFDEIIKYNPSYYKNSIPHRKREEFFNNLDKVVNLSNYISAILAPSLRERIIKKIKIYAKSILRKR